MLDTAAARSISELFLQPLILQRPEGATITDFLWDIFNIDGRSLQKGIVVKEFKLRGQVLLAPLKAGQYIKEHLLKVGDWIYFRYDSDSSYVTLEVFVGQGQKETHVRIGKAVWDTYTQYVKTPKELGLSRGKSEATLNQNYKKLLKYVSEPDAKRIAETWRA